MKPIKTEFVFADAPEPVGMQWRNLCTLENQLAQMMVEKPGFAVVIGQDAWLLTEEGEQTVLQHAINVDGVLSDAQSRFDHGLEWVDIEEGELSDYNQRLGVAIEEFGERLTSSAGLVFEDA